MTFAAKTSDSMLVRTVLSGNTDAFGTLVERHLPKVYAIVHAHLGLDAEVDDVAQDTFVSAFRSLDKLRDPAQFGSWLAVIARNASRQLLRRKARDRKTHEAYGEQGMERVFDDPQDAERYRIISEAIDALSHDHREALLLYYFTGMSTVDMAIDLGISQEAVKKRLQRAREALGGRLAGQAEELLRAQITPRGQAQRIVLVIAGISPAWLATATGGGTALGSGVLVSSLLSKKSMLIGGALAVVAGLGGLLGSASSPEESSRRPDRPVVGAVSTSPAASRPAALAGEKNEELSEKAPVSIEADSEIEHAPPSAPTPLVAADLRQKQSAMAGGNAQRTGFFDVPAPLEKPTQRWSTPLGRVGGYPGVMPVVALDASVLADYGRGGANFFGRFSASGELLWEVGPLKGKRSLGTPTVLSDGTIVHAFNPTTGLLAAYEAQSGAVRWELKGVHARHEAPAVDSRDNLYIAATGPSGLARIDGRTGELVWPEPDRIGKTDFHANASPTLSLDESTLYAGVRPGIATHWLRTLDDGDPSAGRILAVSAKDGRVRWTYHPRDNFRPSGPYGFDPNWGLATIGDDSTIYIQDAWTGIMIALEDRGADVSERWIYDPQWSGDLLRFEARQDSSCVNGISYNAHDAPRMMATYDNTVYMGSFGYPASVHAVNAEDGTLIWRTALEGNPVIGSPIVTREAVYVLAAGDDRMAGTNALFCLDRASGEILWDYPVAGPHGDTGESVGLGQDGTIYVISSGFDGARSVLLALR